jgi:hypothetical protein
MDLTILHLRHRHHRIIALDAKERVEAKRKQKEAIIQQEKKWMSGNRHLLFWGASRVEQIPL